MRPVDADPVNATAPCTSRWSSRSPALPQMQLDRARRERSATSIIARNTDSVRYDVTVAGFTIAGTPASSVGASFSSIPQHGEVERVDVDGDALERHADVATDEGAALRQRLRRPVDVERLVRELAASTRRVREEACRCRPRCRSTNPCFVAPVAAETTIELVLPFHQVLRHRLEHQRALVERHRREARARRRAARTRPSPRSRARRSTPRRSSRR